MYKCHARQPIAAGRHRLASPRLIDGKQQWRHFQSFVFAGPCEQTVPCNPSPLQFTMKPGHAAMVRKTVQGRVGILFPDGIVKGGDIEERIHGYLIANGEPAARARSRHSVQIERGISGKEYGALSGPMKLFLPA